MRIIYDVNQIYIFLEVLQICLDIFWQVLVFMTSNDSYLFS